MAGEERPLQIVCIIGFGRSGSTVLDTILGNHPAVEGLGEVSGLPLRGWHNDEYCACGVRARACTYWNRVWDLWTRRTGGEDLDDYIALQREFEPAKVLPRLRRERDAPSPDLRRYLERSRELYEAIAEVSGKRILVDSSKHPARAYAMARTGLDVRVIHLVRDPRGVAWSMQKSYKRDDRAGLQRDIPGRRPRESAWAWVKANAVSAGVARLFPSGAATRLRYEDLMADPAATLRALGPLLGVDLAEVAERVAAGEAVEVGHTIAGNRVRMQGRIRLAADLEWRARLPARDLWLVQAIAAPLMLRFGYPLAIRAR